MKKILFVAGIVALLITIVPSFLVLNGTISMEQNKYYILIGTVLWFLIAPVVVLSNKKKA